MNRPLVHTPTRRARPPVEPPVTATVPAVHDRGSPTQPEPFFPVAPARDRPSGQSLARAIGIARESDGSGRATVVFPQPPSRAMPNGTNGRTIARQTAELETASLNGGDGPDAFPTPMAETNTYDTGEFEELYDRVLSRLRRDLVVERERRGDLAGAYFRY
ncbi:MAG TPA: hypothetical protein VMA77_06010 [Solirubrobacteraceae bacterium]|nr:hypothetical protein [Solirubrobacteraceae bacterium]